MVGPFGEGWEQDQQYTFLVVAQRPSLRGPGLPFSQGVWACTLAPVWELTEEPGLCTYGPS